MSDGIACHLGDVNVIIIIFFLKKSYKPCDDFLFAFFFFFFNSRIAYDVWENGVVLGLVGP